MKIVLFCHSLLSDWNHGNAHFLRGICSELLARGHDLTVYEPEDSWSYQNLVADEGEQVLAEFQAAYPNLTSIRYQALDLEQMLKDAGLVIVHEWNSPELIAEIGAFRAKNSSFRLLFHDTHHRAVTQPETVAKLQLYNYDGVLAYGSSLREIYLSNGWVRRAWVWHEAADTRLFRPVPQAKKEYDLAWVGNWGDDERTSELEEFLIQPVRELRLKAIVYGVRYPDFALKALTEAGIRFGGWLPNFDVPKVFGRARVTVHVPRRPYVSALPGIPTIRPFEALACGIPLVSAPWPDTDKLFRAGEDLLFAADGKEMAHNLHLLLTRPKLAQDIARNGLQRIGEMHTCARRVDQLLNILA
ncbi:MAG: glycosyltransferase, partial [Verrucomicrobia bacterium]|nr:glycosyltransferase [Verrucomicrobiota bacterium]